MGASYPHRIGRYVLFDEIASGGMATVHIGRLDATGGFKRTVAIKRLHRQYGENPDFVAMLLDEARITARIQHPNVVPVLDIVSADRELLLVMDYVHGESLSQLLKAAALRRERAPTKIVAHIISSILSGLHAAHTCTGDDGMPLKVVHRDVSPQNVIVGSDGVARLIDFGIARAEQRTRGITRDGSVRGKISYMAPEQLNEDPTAIDHRVDVYSAAQVFWEGITGQLLFDDVLPVIIAQKLMKDVVPRASTLVPDLPPILDEIIAKGLAIRPEDRWQSAEEMARAIEDAVPPVTAREIGAWVSSLSGDRLAKRSRLVAMTQEDRLAEQATPLPTRESRPSHPGLRVAPSAASSSPSDPATSDPITLTNPEDVRAAALPKRSSAVRPILIGSLLAVGCVGVFLIATSIIDMRARSSTAAAKAVSTTITPTSLPTASVATTSPVVTSDVVPPPTTATATATPDTTTSSSSTVAVKPTATATPQPKATSPGTKSPSPHSFCDPPWRIDERGVRVLKRECFK